MSIEQLKLRMQNLGVNIILKSGANFDNSEADRIIKRQIIRCSTSVGANYRAATRGKSGKDFNNFKGNTKKNKDRCEKFLTFFSAFLKRH